MLLLTQIECNLNTLLYDVVYVLCDCGGSRGQRRYCGPRRVPVPAPGGKEFTTDCCTARSATATVTTDSDDHPFTTPLHV